MSGELKFSVGDEVVVTGCERCRVGHSPEMKRYIGQKVLITKAEYSKYHHCDFYKIDKDCGHWWWDNRCLEPVWTPTELPTFDSAGTDALSNLLM